MPPWNLAKILSMPFLPPKKTQVNAFIRPFPNQLFNQFSISFPNSPTSSNYLEIATFSYFCNTPPRLLGRQIIFNDTISPKTFSGLLKKFFGFTLCNSCLQIPSNPVKHRGPVPFFLLPINPHARVPGTIEALQKPAPIRGKGEDKPSRFAHCPGQMGNSGIN